MVSIDVWASAKKEDFPSTIQEIINLIGLSSVVTLYRYFWENSNKQKRVIHRIYIPKKVKMDHLLAQLIGMENLAILSCNWGGMWIELPRCKSLFKRVRDEQIRKEFDKAFKECCENKTKALFFVAQKFNLTAESIKKICRN